MSAPLTTRATGRTICPGCNRRFANTSDMPVVEVEGSEENTGRIDSIGQRHRGIGTHPVTRRWHEACLTDFEERNEAYRRQVEQDRWDLIRAICEAEGLDFAEQKTRLEARDD